MKRIAVFALLVLAMGAGVRADDACSQERVEQAAEKVKEIQGQLLAVGVPNGGMRHRRPGCGAELRFGGSKMRWLQLRMGS